MRTRNFAALVLIGATAGGCASMGIDYSDEAVAQLKEGMSKAEVIALLGKPMSVVKMSDGRQQLMWIYSRAQFLGGASGRSLLMTFDANDKYVGQATQAETNLR